MRSRIVPLALVGAALLAARAGAQCPQPSCPRPCLSYPPPTCAPGAPAAPAPSPAPAPGGAEATPTPAPSETPALPSLVAGTQGGGGLAVPGLGTYLDDAACRNVLRLRFDAAYNDNRPDRAEFFYAKCGCFRMLPVSQGGDPNAAGPPLPEKRVDYQDISTYLEIAVDHRASAFIEVPVRFLNPEVNNNTAGLADLNAGFKVALISNPEQTLTFQFRTYAPTGAASRGLGTDHVSLEPGILAYQQLSDRLILQAEFKDWIPIDGSDFAGNVLRYGVGLGYYVIGGPNATVGPAGNESNFFVAPILEFVGWTVLSGKEFDANEGIVKDAAGDTIVNAKVGVRVGVGNYNSLAVSYGRALTGAVWYKDILRVEYRLGF